MLPPLLHPPARPAAALPQPMNWTENYVKEVPISLLREGIDTDNT